MTTSVPRPVFWLFCAMFTMLLLFRMQLLMPALNAVYAREALLAGLYGVLLVLGRMRPRRAILPVYLFLAWCVFVGAHTYLVFGGEMAAAGFTRYVAPALLAPIAAALFDNWKQVRIALAIWMSVVVAGAGTALYQYGGGNAEWLVGEYISMRGGQVRFMTLLGEANVGGMAATLLFVLAFLWVRRWIFKYVLLLACTVLLVLSISKAAVAGTLIAAILVAVLKGHELRKVHVQRRVAGTLLATVVLFAVALSLTSPQVLEDYSLYTRSLQEAIFQREGGSDTAYVIEDLLQRVFDFTKKGIDVARRSSDIFALAVVAGSSFGVAGSAAYDLQPAYAVLPHNSFAEAFLVGGIIQLSLLVWILVSTGRRLLTLRKLEPHYGVLLIVYLVVCAYLPTYPTVYEPITGSVLWLVVGIVANPVLVRAARGGPAPDEAPVPTPVPGPPALSGTVPFPAAAFLAAPRR
jgi:hypothetical protein